ncbi:MAG: hypothetical protein HYV63_21360 [Candidatus Schekmanbacteria bacterium]|nr:hypothetical protein [Candidatus Schekmanbacteria bacterium]
MSWLPEAIRSAFLEPDRVEAELRRAANAFAALFGLEADGQVRKLVAGCSQTADPDLAVRHLAELVQSAAEGDGDALRACPGGSIVDVLPSILQLFGASEVLSRRLIVHPAMLAELARGSLRWGAGERGVADTPIALPVAELASDLAQLRRVRGAVEAAVAVADLAARLSVPEVGRRLFELARQTVGAVSRRATTEAMEAHEEAPDPVILGLGKCGEGCIPYLSDLDVVFLHGGAGVNHASAMTTWARACIRHLATMTRDGSLYEVDARLRPGGRSGELVQSAEQLDRYFSHQARPWEYLAFAAARILAGREAPARTLMELLAGHLRRMDPAPVRDVVWDMKQRMEEELMVRRPNELDLKYEPGGRVELDFIFRYARLLRARTARGSLPDIDEPSLTELTDLLRLPMAALERLGRARELLREVEYRWRLCAGTPRTVLKFRSRSMLVVVKSLGKESRERLVGELAAAREVVHGVFTHVFRRRPNVG